MKSTGTGCGAPTESDPELAELAELAARMGPGSALREHTKDWRVWLFLVRAALLQGGHPTVSAGTLEHSKILTDPLGRAVRTVRYGLDLNYGPDPVGTARQVRELHRDIGGVDAEGKRYHAWNREAWAFVHLTICESLLLGIRTFHSVSDEEAGEIYDGLRAMGSLYGVREVDMPGDVAGLQNWFEEALRETVTDTQLVAAFRAVQTDPPRPAGVPIPAAAWWLVRPLMARVVHHLTGAAVGVLPASTWEIYHPGRTRLNRAEYAATISTLRALSFGPSALRTIPRARRAAA